MVIFYLSFMVTTEKYCSSCSLQSKVSSFCKMSTYKQRELEKKKEKAQQSVRSLNVINGFNLKVDEKGNITTLSGQKVKNMKTERFTKRERKAFISSNRDAKFVPQMLSSLKKCLSDFTEMPGSFNAGTEHLGVLGNALKECLPALLDANININNAASVFSSSIDKLVKSGVDIRVVHEIAGFDWTSIKSLLSNKLFLLAMVGGLVVVAGPKKAFLIMSIGALVNISYKFCEDIAWAIDFIKSFDTEDGHLPQISEGDLVQRVLLRIWEYLVPDVDEANPILDIVNPTGKRSRRGHQLDYYLMCLKSLLNVLKSRVPLCRKIFLLFEPFPLAVELAEEVDGLVTEFRSGSLPVSEVGNRASALRDRCEVELLKNASNPSFTYMSKAILSAKHKCEKMIAESILLGAGRDVTRVPPAAFLIIGAPGVGKSYVLDQISTAVLMLLNEHDYNAARRAVVNKSEHVFSKNFADKFWEGYNNQPIVYLDEVGQSRSGPSVPKSEDEYIDLINMVNDKPFPLNMAQLEKKGTVFFDSKLILGTTNIAHFKIESINEPAAYDRRWRKFKCEIMNECADVTKAGARVFSRSKTEAYYESLGLSPPEIKERIDMSDFLRFVEVDTLVRNSNCVGPTLTTREFINIILDDVRAYHVKVETKKGARDGAFSYWSSQFGFPNKEEAPLMDVPDFVQDIWEKFKSFRTAKPQGIFDPKDDYDDLKHDMFSYIATGSGLSRFLGFIRGKDWVCTAASAFTLFADMVDKRIALFVGAIGMLSTIWSVGRWLWPTKPNDVPQHAVVDTVAQHRDRIMRRNVVRFLTLGKGGAVQHRGYGIGVCDRLVIIPRHYLISWAKKLENDPSFEVYYSLLGQGYAAPKHPLSIKKLLDSKVFGAEGREDICAIYLWEYPVQFPDLLKSVGKLKSSAIATFPAVDNDCIIDGCYVDIHALRSNFGHRYEFEGENFSTPDTIVYSYPTVDGDCGLPIFDSSRYSDGRIVLGMHIAGNKSSGVGVPFTSQFIDSALLHYVRLGANVYAQLSKDDHIIFRSVGDGGFHSLPPVVGDLPAGKVVYGRMKAPHPPVRTNIVRSPLFGKVGFEAKTMPAFLQPFEGREGLLIDPIALSTDKYSNDTVLDPVILSGCVQEYTDHICNMRGQFVDDRLHRRILTYEEAVAGMPGVIGLDGLPRRTSAGYPYCTMLPRRGKFSLWGDEGEYDFSSLENEFLEERCNDIINAARDGTRMMHVFFDFPKDERRPIDKVWAGKTRKISACPVDLAVCIRMYFGAFVQWYISNRIANGSAVGINVYSNEIDFLVSHLNRVDNSNETRPRVIAGDFGNFDGSLPRGLIEQFAYTVDCYYGNDAEGSRIRRVLLLELANSRHILPNGTVYEWNGSNASGNPLTTVLNTWCNNILLRFAIYKASGDNGSVQSFLSQFRPHYCIVAYGDDNLISVNRNLMGFVSQERLTDVLCEMGFEYTDEVKSSNSRDRTIDEVSFLKRTFERNSVNPFYKYVAPLALDTILESIQWQKRGDECFESVRENVNKMVRELSLHRRDVFDKYVPMIVESSRSTLGFVPIPHTYEECQHEILCGHPQW